MESIRDPLQPRKHHKITPLRWKSYHLGGIIISLLRDLHVRRGTLNGQMFRDIILRQQALLFSGARPYIVLTMLQIMTNIEYLNSHTDRELLTTFLQGNCLLQ